MVVAGWAAARVVVVGREGEGAVTAPEVAEVEWAARAERERAEG